MSTKKKINNVSAETENAMLRKSAYGLPNRPSQVGMRAEDVKKAFYSSLIDDEASLLSELKRIITEANDIFDYIYNDSDNHITDSKNPHKVTKNQVGLSNVDNTSDLNKPVSTLQQAELDKKINYTDVKNDFKSLDTDKPLSANCGSLLDKRVETNSTKINEISEELKNLDDKYATDDDITATMSEVSRVYKYAQNNYNSQQSEIDDLKDEVDVSIKNITLNSDNGVLTIIRTDGTTFNIDLPLEYMVKSGRYNVSTKNIELVLDNNTIIEIPASDLTDEYYGDEITISMYVDSNDNKIKFKISDTYKNKILKNESDIKTLQNEMTGLDERVAGTVVAKIDASLSETSENAVQNKIITAELKSIKNNYVKLSGGQNIDGYKKFLQDLQIGPSLTLLNSPNGGIEIGRRDGTTSTPYIDFHTDGNPISSTDYNVRMMASGGTKGTNGDGTLNISAGKLTLNNKDLALKDEVPKHTLSLVPSGTEIPKNNNLDLNSIDYIKVGLYYCGSDATTQTLSNCPTDRAFMMEVYSPLNTIVDNETINNWVYRIRKIMTYTGEQYIQQLSSGSTVGEFTYGAWNKIAHISDFLNSIYPVGSVYLSINNNSPASFLGGSWEKLSSGYALWTASSDAGNTIGAGLPNITGGFAGVPVGAAFPGSPFGAFQSSEQEGSSNTWGTSNAARATINFNASNSNNIYGASSTVQPPAYKVYAWKRIS